MIQVLPHNTVRVFTQPSTASLQTLKEKWAETHPEDDPKALCFFLPDGTDLSDNAEISSVPLLGITAQLHAQHPRSVWVTILEYPHLDREMSARPGWSNEQLEKAVKACLQLKPYTINLNVNNKGHVIVDLHFKVTIARAFSSQEPREIHCTASEVSEEPGKGWSNLKTGITEITSLVIICLFIRLL